jgi:trigger factor
MQTALEKPIESTIETLSQLERRLNVAVPRAQIEGEVEKRLARLAKTVKLPGFRPGKVPIKMVEQSHGQQVSSEVLGDAVSKSFSAAVASHGLKVAGDPRIEPVMPTDGADLSEYQFSATFEVFPEFTLPSPADQIFKRFASPVGDAEVDRTIETLRRQRTHWEA